MMRNLSFALVFTFIAMANNSDAQPTDQQLRTDWANLAKYRDANSRLTPPAKNENRVVFMGNSITEGWQRYFPTMFAGKPYINRGIGGQTTPQMLVRFHPDVVALKPKVVVILAGTNDIAGNTGPSTLEMIEDNLASMAEIASANRIKVVLSFYLDYHSAMADERGGMRSELASDGVHPTEAGYRVMAPLVEKAIEKALRVR